MRVPFSSVLGPALTKYNRLYSRVCAPKLFGHNTYSICLGILGTVVTLIDIRRIVNGEAPTCQGLWKNRLSRSDQIMTNETARDMKLMSSVLGVEHYSLLALGAFTDNPVLLLPWLLMGILVILIEGALFASRLFYEGIHMNRSELLFTAMMVHNWLQVFCLFNRQVRRCEY